jgi:hypothetical protein
LIILQFLFIFYSAEELIDLEQKLEEEIVNSEKEMKVFKKTEKELVEETSQFTQNLGTLCFNILLKTSFSVKS